MFSKATLFTALLATVASVSAASQAIWNPTITSPKAGDVWPAGSVQNVTWCGPLLVPGAAPY